MSPDRVVVGVESDKARDILARLYKPFLINNFRVIFMDIPSAEMTKYAANSMLATRISFMNDIANLCELVGADVNMVRSGIGSDTRIGRKFYMLDADMVEVVSQGRESPSIKTSDDHGYSMEVLKAVERVNAQQKGILFKKLKKVFDRNLCAVRISLYGDSRLSRKQMICESTAL